MAFRALGSSLCLCSGLLHAQDSPLRTLRFETTEVTSPDMAVSSNGEFLVFSMVGKLFRVPTRGGDAQQLTFGAHYDRGPVISPDDRVVAFQSDRDGSDGNIFLLTLATGEVRQVTREQWADSPSWSPDGSSLVYLSLDRSKWLTIDSVARPPAEVRRVSVAGGQAEMIRAVGPVWSAFYLPDGRIGWTVVERDAARNYTTRIEVRDSRGVVTPVVAVRGSAHPVTPSHDGVGFYARFIPPIRRSLGDHALVFLNGDTVRTIMTLAGRPGAIAVAAGNSAIYLGTFGHIVRVVPRNGQRTTVAFRASVAMAVHPRIEPRPWRPVTPGTTAAPRSIADPRLSPDGTRILFRAAGRMWEQRIAGTEPARMLGKDGLPDAYDASYSPDGRSIAYTDYPGNYAELHVLDLQTGVSRRIGRAAEDTTEECGIEYPVWSPSGQIVAAKECAHDIVLIDPASDSVRVLAKVGNWQGFPHVSSDGQTVYYQARLPGTAPGLYRISLTPGAAAELVTTIDGVAVELAVAGDWIAGPLSNYIGLRITRLDAAGRPGVARVLQDADGQDFSINASGTDVLYVSGDKLWQQPLAGGTRREIPIRLRLTAPPAPPSLLLQRVRVLDFAAGGFSSETALLVENGRIRAVGAEAATAAPPGSVVIDAAGRFAIPGLFDVHTHGGSCGGTTSVMRGITSSRNLGGRLESQHRNADAAEFTSEPLPRCTYSGRILEGAAGRNEDHFFVYPTDTADARALVRRWHLQGAQFIKLYVRLPWPMHRAAADEARRLGLPVVAHGESLEQAIKGVTLGYTELTHWDSHVYDDVIQMAAAAGMPWDPTLGIFGGREAGFRRDPSRFAPGNGDLRSVADNTLFGNWSARLEGVRNAYRRGVLMLPGTDGGPAGRAFHWELEFLAEAGIPNIDVLRAATLQSAELVGADAELGSLESGKLADIVLLDANPLDDIRNTQRIWRVITGGRVHDPRTPQ